MTILAHNAAVLGLQVDSWRLFAGEDEDYPLWLDEVLRQVGTTRGARKS